MAEIRSGVTLSLKDIFSAGMKKAAGAASGFAEKTLGAFDKVDKAISGTGAKLAAFGLTLSVGAAAKGIIEMDHRMARLGVSAGATAEEVAKLKKQIFDTAQAADIKIDSNSLLNAVDIISNKTNDLKYAEDNIRNVALAIQATGESGETIGDIFSEFQKFGYTTEQITSLMDDLSAQANIGSYSLADFAKRSSEIFRVYNDIGTAPENIKKANAALQILNEGMRNPQAAANALGSAIKDLGESDVQKNLKRMGIDVVDKTTGKLRDFHDIMLDIAAKSDNAKNANYLKRIFTDSSMQAINTYVLHGERMNENLSNLGDTTGLLQKQSAAMAGTLQSNIKNLQTAFNKFADSNLTKPLSNLTELLNKLSEDPERLKKVFTGIAIGIGAIAAVKGIAGISRLIGSLSQLKGGKINMGSLTAASAMPVYVTNWGGGAGNLGMGSGGKFQPTQLAKGAPLTNAQNAVKNLKPAQYAGGAGASALTASFIKIPQMMNELEEIKQNEELTAKERAKAKGGAIGDATGSIAGAAVGGAAGIAAGAAVGAAVGSVVPVLGTAVGALVGAGIGALGMYLGGKAGRKIGEGIGEASADDGPKRIPPHSRHQRRMSASELPSQITQTGSNISPQKVELGQAEINLHVDLTGDRPTLTTDIQNNTNAMRFNPGSRVEQRRSGL